MTMNFLTSLSTVSTVNIKFYTEKPKSDVITVFVDCATKENFTENASLSCK